MGHRHGKYKNNRRGGRGGHTGRGNGKAGHYGPRNVNEFADIGALGDFQDDISFGDEPPPKGKDKKPRKPSFNFNRNYNNGYDRGFDMKQFEREYDQFVVSSDNRKTTKRIERTNQFSIKQQDSSVFVEPLIPSMSVLAQMAQTDEAEDHRDARFGRSGRKTAPLTFVKSSSVLDPASEIEKLRRKAGEDGGSGEAGAAEDKKADTEEREEISVNSGNAEISSQSTNSVESSANPTQIPTENSEKGRPEYPNITNLSITPQKTTQTSETEHPNPIDFSEMESHELFFTDTTGDPELPGRLASPSGRKQKGKGKYQNKFSAQEKKRRINGGKGSRNSRNLGSNLGPNTEIDTTFSISGFKLSSDRIRVDPLTLSDDEDDSDVFAVEEEHFIAEEKQQNHFAALQDGSGSENGSDSGSSEPDDAELAFRDYKAALLRNSDSGSGSGSGSESDTETGTPSEAPFGTLPEDLERDGGFSLGDLLISAVRHGIGGSQFCVTSQQLGNDRWIPRDALEEILVERGLPEHRTGAFVRHTLAQFAAEEQREIAEEESMQAEFMAEFDDAEDSETELDAALEELLAGEAEAEAGAGDDQVTILDDPNFYRLKRKYKIPEFPGVDRSTKAVLTEKWISRAQHAKAKKRERKRRQKLGMDFEDSDSPEPGNTETEFEEIPSNRVLDAEYDLYKRYPKIMHVNEMKWEIEAFILSGKSALAFPPMDTHGRQVLHKLAHAYNLKTRSFGSRQTNRYVVAIRVAATGRAAVDRRAVDRILRGRKYFARPGNSRSRNPETAEQMKSYQRRENVHVRYHSQDTGTVTETRTNADGTRTKKILSSGRLRDGDLVAADAPALGHDNIGHRMLQKMGWTAGQGLGKSNEGISDPILAKMKKTKHGLR